jgi:hypothetical protein
MTSFAPMKGDHMNPRSTDTSDEDVTLTLLRTLDDGSMKGLAQFHLLRMELENIRALPERRYGDRNVPRR